jgi:hypothetical protein
MKIQNKKDNNEEKTVQENKSNIFTNIWVDLFTYLLILTVIFGSYRMYFKIDERISTLNMKNPDYKFPTYSELQPSIYYFVILIILHKLFLTLTINTIKRNLTPKYFEKGAEYLAEIYKKKVSTAFFKAIFFIFSTGFAYYIMKDLDFFPSTLFGDGQFSKLFEPGYPDFIYFHKPEYFDLYYNINFAFALFDGWVLISNPLQSDFLFMVLHHLVTYSLIVFSFISNYSHIGAIVYYIHYFGDIFSCIVRTVIHLKVPDIVMLISTFVFLVVFSYTRLYVYGDVLYQTLVANYEWEVIEFALFIFLSILMLLNVLWVVLITKKFIKYVITGNMEEIYKIKVENKKIN